MHINPFGFPLGAGAQSASAFASTGLGFIDALGAMSQGGLAQPMAIGAPALAQPTASDSVQPDMPFASNGALAGLRQPASLSQLMATAAKLPAAEAAPLAPAPVPAIETDTPPLGSTAMLAEAPAIVAQPKPVIPVELPSPTQPEVEAQAPVRAQSVPAKPSPQSQALSLAGDGQLPVEETLAPEAPALAAPAEPAATPRKAPRVAAVAVEAEAAEPDAKSAVPAELLAVGMPSQPAAQPQPQPQRPAPREAMQAASGAAAPANRKSAAAHTPVGEAAQASAIPGTPSTADFADAIAASGDSAGGQANTDAQGQPDARPAGIARTDAPVPSFQPAQAAANPGAPAGAPASAPAEPVIEARAGHLGQSLGVEIARKVELGEETLRIRLNPIELGRIEVTLAFDDKGSLQATVRTESAQAMDLLRQDAPDLARTLDQAGVRTDAQSFRFESRAGDGGGQQAQQQHQQSNRGQFASSDDDAGAAEPIYRPVRSDGQVDLIA